MIFDELGLPKDTGASDLQDSSRLAGVMTVFRWPRAVDLSKYILSSSIGKKYVRHPSEHKYDFSRDQALCLIAGLCAQRLKHLVSKDYIDGRDLFSPSHMGHIRVCQGLKPTWYQNAWLWMDVVYSAKVKPLSEPNQLLCMLMVHPNLNYLKYWLANNSQWRKSITDYWSGWRGEDELAQHMIKVLENV